MHSYGVLLSGEFPATSSTAIEFNDFYIDNPSSLHYNSDLRGIALMDGNKNNVSIYTNTFDSDQWASSSLPGNEMAIWLRGSIGTGNEVVLNRFIPNLNLESNNFIRGFFSLDNTGTLYCQNDLQEANGLMVFVGTSMGTQYIRNIHTGSAVGLRIQEGFIGEQGTEGGEHHGNEWYDKWLNLIPTWHTNCYPTQQADNSRFYIHTQQSQRNPPFPPYGYAFFSEFHPADISPDQMDEWFKPDPTGLPSTASCLDHIVISTETDRAIAAGTIDLTGLSAAHGWTAKRYLYAKLMQNPGLQGNYIEFAPFLSAQSQTSVGQLYAVEQKIAEGLIVSTNFDTQLSQIKASETSAINQLLLVDSTLNASTDVATLNAALISKRLMFLTG